LVDGESLLDLNRRGRRCRERPGFAGSAPSTPGAADHRHPPDVEPTLVQISAMSGTAARFPSDRRLRSHASAAISSRAIPSRRTAIVGHSCIARGSAAKPEPPAPSARPIPASDSIGSVCARAGIGIWPDPSPEVLRAASDRARAIANRGGIVKVSRVE